jgi:hypothetical protein
MSRRGVPDPAVAKRGTPKPVTAEPHSRPLATLADVELVDELGARVSGEELARLLAFAHAGCPGWRQALESPAEELAGGLTGLASLVNHAEESLHVIESDVLHFVHGVIEFLAALVVASAKDAHPRRWRVEVRAAGAEKGKGVAS